MGVFPVPQVWGQVPPESAPYLILRGAPSAQVPKHRLQEQLIVPGWAALLPWVTRQMRFKKSPNLVGNIVASMQRYLIPTPPFHSPNFKVSICNDYDDNSWALGALRPFDEMPCLSRRACRHQFVDGSLLDHLAVLQDVDPICPANGGEKIRADYAGHG